MATIQNDRDVLLQAAAVRVVPVTIAISDVVGLPEAIAKAEKGLEITASAAYFSGAAGAATSPAAITLTAVRKNGLAGTVSWAVEAGAATLVPSGGTNNTCNITGSTVSGASVTVRARVSDNGRNYDARITIGKYGALTMQNAVDLTTQVTGALNAGNVTGLGALALLNTVDLNTQTVGALNGATQVTNLGTLAYANTVDLNTQTVGALNGATQVTNLGTLAYANAIAANQIGAGTLAVGVAYAGTVNATQVNAGSFSGKEFTGGTFTGGRFRTTSSGRRVEIDSTASAAHTVKLYDTTGAAHISLNANEFSGNYMYASSYANPTLHLRQSGGGGSGSGVAPVLRLESLNASAHLQLDPVSSFPSGTASFGQLIMHSTHGLCGYNGFAWVKFTVTAI